MTAGGPAAPRVAQLSAETGFRYLQPAVAGLLAAMHATRWLRPAEPSLVWYPVTGALPGIYLLATEGLGHAGGKVLSAAPDGAAGAALFTDAAKLKYAVIGRRRTRAADRRPPSAPVALIMCAGTKLH